MSKAFKAFFTSYTHSFNKIYSRRGSLFEPRFKRVKIESDKYLVNTIIYIHKNPIKHGFVDYCKDWQHSSYKIILDPQKENWIVHKEVISLFDDVKNFKYCHNHNK